MPLGFWIAIGCLTGAIILGLSLAYYNLKDYEARMLRLKKRKEERRNRRRPYNWPS